MSISHPIRFFQKVSKRIHFNRLRSRPLRSRPLHSRRARLIHIRSTIFKSLLPHSMQENVPVVEPQARGDAADTIQTINLIIS